MCMTCGCNHPGQHQHEHDHSHPHNHGEHNDAHLSTHHHGPQAHEHAYAGEFPTKGSTAEAPVETRTIRVEQEILLKNNTIAEQTRVFLRAREILALNLVSSPGAGKTTLLEKTLSTLRGTHRFAVIEGDQQTDNDAQRIQATGSPAIQITTGQVCHLDAQMVQNALFKLDPDKGSIVMIENVGNLVCPALFDLGEAAKVVVASVTEGTDKPAKYPYMFREAGVILLNKIDLLPYVEFNQEAFTTMARAINPDVEIMALSATTGEGMDAWYQWMETAAR